ncbi:FAD-binding oxidoreductase (plasmid) [Agrobacterium tumefaciens]|uniref:NAD(P)/FAD-dependent oxidoreductase n=1 Tax=Agrobacterium tumefaciens TaxID=358 RepID=UPI0021D35070|nr:FAD-dependent oxidoreductase [Agrobacterium tumefaciens]NTZ64188.1 FAD-binding oxidoreductase [Agrobacterium tumefaciens]UXT00169.1 FAD-binding oxidoreductase [Agrobacterium tumefaciens]UXT52870.1 FAD-binding oxidoreductase [Agrobacterium tumefaciens]UXT68930.1 FAD-binding oxidoreductase [Agrobacterium tumefaciens]
MVALPLPSDGGASFDVAIVGGGIVGCSVALGLVRLGARVAILDEADRAFRASRGNFGMVWVQGKGLDFPAYARLTRRASDGWADFSRFLFEETGIDTGFSRPGGLGFCLTQEEFEAKRSAMTRLAEQTEELFKFEMLDRGGVAGLLPWIGGEIAGAVYCPHDGGANPLNLLRALQSVLAKSGATLIAGGKVRNIAGDGFGYSISTDEGKIGAARVLLAAGLGNRELAPQVGLEAPVRPVRGQILVTNRLAPFMPYVSNIMRQMPEGTCLIGDTMEEVGFDDSVLTASMSVLANRALRVFPSLGHASLVRSWGALRIMSPDGLPLYARSPTHPGAWLATVHSGVTLAPVHCEYLPKAILDDEIPDVLAPFSPARFTVGNTSHITSH